MGLRLTEVVHLLVEVTGLLELDLGVAEGPPSAIESLKERVTEEGCRVLCEVHVRLLGLIQNGRCIAVVVVIGLVRVLGRGRRPIEVEI